MCHSLSPINRGACSWPCAGEYSNEFHSIDEKRAFQFFLFLSLPELLSFIIITFLPESPKFVLSQGDPDAAYKILQKMNRVNNGKNAFLDEFDIYEDGELDECQTNTDNNTQQKPLSLTESVIVQTVPLFQSPYLFRTVLICVIQFTVFFTCQGLNVFFTEISNRLAVNSKHTERMPMCDILSLNKTQFIDTHADEISEVI